ncbi:MAG: hypothetical protein J1F12_07890 [Muribaculaceae bacterium]|nr:hypothetical protein [Muribaculaceae bacterium]
MKKILSAFALICVTFGANAQFTETLKELGIFNHLGVGVGVGTTGISIEAGTTITPWVQLRAGADIMPTIKIKTDLDLEEYGVTSYGGYNTPYLSSVGIQGKLTNTLGHFLFDAFPFTKHSSFHITVGGYFGGSSVISAYNTDSFEELKDVYMYNHRLGSYSDIPMSEGKIGAALGNYFIEPGPNGDLKASIKTWKFRPYVGFGFGRIVPNSRINCLFDMGVQFWGKPGIWNDINHEKITSEGADGDDGGVIKIISKVSVYPVINIKIVGKIF